MIRERKCFYCITDLMNDFLYIPIPVKIHDREQEGKILRDLQVIKQEFSSLHLEMDHCYREKKFFYAHIQGGRLFLDPDFMDQLALQHVNEVGNVIKKLFGLLSKPCFNTIDGKMTAAFSIDTYAAGIKLLEEVLNQANKDSAVTNFMKVQKSDSSIPLTVNNLKDLLPSNDGERGVPRPMMAATYRSLGINEKKALAKANESVAIKYKAMKNYHNDKETKTSIKNATRFVMLSRRDY